MTVEEMKMITEIIEERQEIAYEQLKNNKSYQELCEHQERIKEVIDRLHNKLFTAHEKNIIDTYYKAEMKKKFVEDYIVYIQGFMDGLSTVKS